jgi:hypothetical protein
MDKYIIIFKFGLIKVECHFKNEKHFLEDKTAIESSIVDNIKKGMTIPDIVEYWACKIISIKEEWETITEDNRPKLKELKNAIIILKKLKFEFSPEDECCWFLKPPKRRTFKPCVMCQVETKMKCSCCREVYYCGVECQKKDWKEHNATYI